MKVGVIVFPGSNCDRDMFHVLTDVFNLDTQYFWHEKNLPKDIDAVVLPGGFSYGDRLRAGVIAAHSRVLLFSTIRFVHWHIKLSDSFLSRA